MMSMRLGVVVVALAACGGDDGDDPGTPGTFTVSGTVRYEDRPQLETAFLGPPVPVVVRGAGVAIIAEDDGATLATGTIGDDGTYTIQFDGNADEAVHVLVIAESTAAARPIAVRNVNPATGEGLELHGFGGDTFAAADGTHDVLITVTSGEAGAFNIFDTLVTVMDRIPAFTASAPPPLTALWQDGSDDGTYYIDGAHEMHLLGEASDDDGFDDAVIIHEAGHYIEDTLGKSDSPGGGHDGSPTDPRLAWSEGFSTYIAMAMRDSPLYIDTAMDGGFTYNGDTSLTKANPGLPIGQDVSEDTVTEILFDMGDGGGGDDDTLDGTHDTVLSLAPYLRTAVQRVVGKTGIDLVDALDGWFITTDLTSCAAMRAIVNTARSFPYDYGGTAGTCPP